MGCYCTLFIFIFKFYWPYASDGFFCEQSWKLKANRYTKHTGAKQLRWVVYSFLLILYTYFATSSNFIYSQDGVQVIAVYLTNHRRCSSFTAIQYCAPLYFTVSFVFFRVSISTLFVYSYYPPSCEELTPSAILGLPCSHISSEDRFQVIHQ